MKKLILTAAIVCATVISQAATANWSVSASNLYNGGGDTATKLASGTVLYMFDASKVTQAALFEVFAADTSMDFAKATGYAGSVAVGATAGVVPTSTATFSYGEQGGGDYSYYFAIVNGDNIYLSKTITKTANETSTAAAIGFGNQAPTTGASSKNLPTDGFVSVGQWAAVPEPTSGLLMLVGLAGLALRRRLA